MKMKFAFHKVFSSNYNIQQDNPNSHDQGDARILICNLHALYSTARGVSCNFIVRYSMDSNIPKDILLL